MSEQALIAKLKQRGYWRVSIQPSEYLAQKYTFSEIKEIVRKCTVSLRGWDYPHTDPKNTFNRDGFVESYCEFEYLIEYWRFYRSGKFVHLLGMREDSARYESMLLERFRWYGGGAEPPTGLRGLSIIGAVYTLTEIFQFAIRLAQHGVLESGAKIDVELFGLHNRMLFFEDILRHLSSSYISRELYFKKEAVFASGEELTEKGFGIAIDWFLDTAAIFQWDSCSRKILEDEQRKFLERRI